MLCNSNVNQPMLNEMDNNEFLIGLTLYNQVGVCGIVQQSLV